MSQKDQLHSDAWCKLAINCQNALEAQEIAKIFYHGSSDFKQMCISQLLGYFAGKNAQLKEILDFK